jgi:pyridoxine 4-dehydrogenase
VLKEALDAGKVRAVGLSEVSVEEIEAARAVVPIATVQNLYNVTNRQSEDVLEHCEANGIGFIPWFPLAAGDLAEPGGPLATASEHHGVRPGAVALAWLLARSPVMLPIPGTGKVAHLEENMAAADLQLDKAELDAISTAVDSSVS